MVFDIELCELFVYFGKPLLVASFANIFFLPVHRFSFNFVYGFLCYAKVYKFDSVAQSCITLGDPMDCSTPGLPVLYHLPELAQTHVH